MFEAQIHEDIWIRWIPYTWEKTGGWRTDIRPSVLKNEAISKALFILEDNTCVFIPREELKKALSQKSPGSNGSITFNVDPHLNKIDEHPVKMGAIRSSTKENKERKELLKEY